MSDPLEMRLRIYHDQCEEYVEVSEDADGLGLIELRHRDESDKIVARITMTDAQSVRLIQAVSILREFMAMQALRSMPTGGVEK